jgi:polysaccharide biosynthesis/export protein
MRLQLRILHGQLMILIALLLSFGLTQGVFSQRTAPGSSAQGADRNITSNDPALGEPAAGSPEPLIAGGELLKVTVLGAPEFDQELRVSASGDISLQLVGPVHVAELSARQAELSIEKRLSAAGFFTDPHVSVFIKEYAATQGVSVLGEVQRPGVYPLLGIHRLFDVLSVAGGTTPKAGRTVTITHRANPQQPIQLTMSKDPENLGSNVEILPGDTVIVSKGGVVYVVGGVRRPMALVMEQGMDMTVLQAVAMAEGTMPDASLTKTKLIRRSGGTPQELPIDLKKILAAKVPDVKLQAEDIVFVPSSAYPGMARRTLDAVVQMTTGLIVYRHY